MDEGKLRLYPRGAEYPVEDAKAMRFRRGHIARLDCGSTDPADRESHHIAGIISMEDEGGFYLTHNSNSLPPALYRGTLSLSNGRGVRVWAIPEL